MGLDLILVLLAAGESRRFGENKLLYLLEGKPMYRYVGEQMEKLESRWKEKVIVSAYGEILAEMEARGYCTVENKGSGLGISYSIRLALEKIDKLISKAPERESFAVCFAVCDQPYLRAKTVEGLISGFLESGKGIGCLSFGGRTGNPVIFSEPYLKELMQLRGDAGGKKVLNRHLSDIYFYETEDPRELEDMDIKPGQRKLE